MRRLIATLCILVGLLGSGCAHTLPYDTTEKTLVGTAIGFQAIDAWQTNKLLSHGGFKEGNPVITKVLGQDFSPLELSILKAAVVSPVWYFFVHKAKTHKARKQTLWVLNIISVAPVISNGIVGADVLFSF